MAELFYASASFILAGLALAGLTFQLTTAENIAFNAHTLGSGHYPLGKVLKFSHVLLNDGNGYSSATGYFTAPVSGVYQFTAHVCNWSGKHMVIAIMKEIQQIAVSTGVDSDRSSCNSVTTIAKVRKNEHVYVLSPWYDSHMMSGDSRELTYGNGSCYYVSVEQKTWSDARAFCEQFDAHLAVVTSADEEQITKDIIQGSHARGTYTWLGCYEPGEEGRWYLVTGEPFIYTNWGVSIQVVEIEKIALTGVMGGMTINVSIVTTSYVKCEKAVK